MNDGFTCRVRTHGDAVVVVVRGEPDMATGSHLSVAVRARLRPSSAPDRCRPGWTRLPSVAGRIWHLVRWRSPSTGRVQVRRVPDAIFSHPRLAAVYDAFDGNRGDLDAYVAIADEVRAGLVLDVGCGTGNLAVRLAASGRTVVGVDPAGASLEVAKGKDGAAVVTWIHGDVTALPALGADPAMMTDPTDGASTTMTGAEVDIAQRHE